MIIKKIQIIVVLILGCLSNINAEDLYLVTGDKVNVREYPNDKAKILLQLRIGEKVKLIKSNGKKEKINSIEGEWFFIDTDHFRQGTREIIQGWVFDYYLLSDMSKFERIKNLKFEKCIFDLYIGDSNFYFEIFQDGTYISKDKDLYLNKKGEKSKGTVYRFNKLIMLKNSSGGTDILFYINKDGFLCSTWFDLQGNSECSKCKWE